MPQSQLTLVRSAFRDRKWKKLFICLGLCAALAAIGDVVDRSTNALQEIGLRDRLVQINQGLAKELQSVNSFNLAKVFYRRLLDSSYEEDNDSTRAGFVVPNQTDLVPKPYQREWSLGSDPMAIPSPITRSSDPLSVWSQHQNMAIPNPEESKTRSWLDDINRLEPPPTNIIFGAMRIPWAFAYTIKTEWRDGIIGKSLTLLTILLIFLFLSSLSDGSKDVPGCVLTIALIPLIVSLLATAAFFVLSVLNSMFGELLLLTSFTVVIFPMEVALFLICGAAKEFVHKSLDDWRDGVLERTK